MSEQQQGQVHQLATACVATIVALPLLPELQAMKLLTHGGPQWAPSAHRYAEGVAI